jgi:REP element-mobilizing transposase RayT
MARRDRQLGMKLRPAPRWGGWRENAGRKRSAKSGVPHTSREGFSSSLPAHVTVKLMPDLLSLRTKMVVRALERTFAVGCERSDFRLVHYSLLGNHAHLIVEARGAEALGRGMMSIGSRLALAVNKVMGRKKGRVVAERYHARLLKTPREVRNALRYVLLNARHHAAVTARKALRAMEVVLDPASSARWFDGWRLGRGTGPGAERDGAAHDHVPVARARTWLLRVGWRRHGLLDPAEVPG